MEKDNIDYDWDKHAREMAEMDDYDAHTCDYSDYDCCSICGAVRYGSFLYRELYGGE